MSGPARVGQADVWQGDMRDVLATLPADAFHSCVTDPPYHLTSIVKRFGGQTAKPAKVGATGAYARAATGFMGERWDGGDVAFRPETWAEVWRVLKPGAHLAAFGGTRTYHRLACAIEDAGFEIRDSVCWHYGSGFPKSHDVSKGIDKAEDYRLKAAVRRAAVEAVEAAGLALPGNSRWDWTSGEHAPGDRWWAEFQAWLPTLTDEQRERVEREVVARGYRIRRESLVNIAGPSGGGYDITAPATPEAARWAGWGTALKPATELIVLARKPLGEPTVAANVLRHGTGALNVDGCRVGTSRRVPGAPRGPQDRIYGRYGAQDGTETGHDPDIGRWPANLCHDGTDEVTEAFAAFGRTKSRSGGVSTKALGRMNDDAWVAADLPRVGHDDAGTAARFFYCAKATAAERAGSRHPTVKPVALMRWLCRLVTPPGGLVLDPFAGSGTTGEAALREGFRPVLVEREAQYHADCMSRLGRLSGADAPLLAGAAA